MPTIAIILLLVGVQSPAGGRQGLPASEARTARDQAATALDRKDNAGALAAVDRAILLAPDDPLAHLLRCRALAGLRRHEEAITACTQSLRISPDNGEALRDRGHYYLNLGRVDLGLSDLQRAMRLTKDDRAVFYHLGMAYYLKGDFGAAAEAYEACSKNSTDAAARIECQAWLYPSLRRSGREADARLVLDAVKTDPMPGHPGNYQDRLLLFTGGRTKQAVAATMTAEGALSETTVGYTLGLWHLLEGRPDKARAYFEQVLKTDYTTSWGYRAAVSEMQRIGGDTSK